MSKHTTWIDDPLSDIQKYAQLLRESTSSVVVLPYIYTAKLKEIEQRWLQGQSNMLWISW